MKTVWLSNDPGQPGIPLGANVYNSILEMINDVSRVPDGGLTVMFVPPFDIGHEEGALNLSGSSIDSPLVFDASYFGNPVTGEAKTF